MPNKVYRKEDDTEFFPTPAKIRDDLYAMIPDNVHYILDPCCGDGGLELDDDKYDYTLYDLVDRSEGKFAVNVGDFLEQPVCPAPDGRKFDAVVMNPPFGLTKEFVEKSFQFSDDIYMIAPFKKVLRDFPEDVVEFHIDWRYPYAFGIRASIGVIHLHKNRSFQFGRRKDAYKDFLSGQLPKEQTFASALIRASSAPKDKWFIVNRITVTRVQRGHQLIQDMDIYKPGDDSAFVAIAGNVNTKKGDHLDRNILTFNTYEDAKAFQKKYDDNDEYVRNYIYKYANELCDTKYVPLLK